MFFDAIGKYKDFGLLITRIGIGASYIYVHGSGKLFGGPERWTKVGEAMGNFGIDFFPAVWGFLAACAEFFGGICILLGLFFRPAALMILITMIVAATNLYYAGNPLLKVAYPLEMAFVMIGLFFLGPGKYNLEEHL